MYQPVWPPNFGVANFGVPYFGTANFGVANFGVPYHPAPGYGVVWYSLLGSRENIGRGPRGYTRSDERILEDICERLTLDPIVDASGIEVKVEKGRVILTGNIESYPIKHMVEDIVVSVPGVQSISNQIEVGPVDQAGSAPAGKG